MTPVQPLDPLCKLDSVVPSCSLLWARLLARWLALKWLLMMLLLCRLLKTALKCRLLWLALVPLAGPSIASFVARHMAVVRDQRLSLRSGGNDLELLLKPFDLVLKLEQACQHLATYFILMSGKR